MTMNADPVARRLARSVCGRLSGCAAGAGDAERAREVLREIDAFAFEAPVGLGGYDLGLTSGVVVASELGRRALPDVYSPVATTIDGLGATGDPAGRGPGLCAGDVPVSFAGMDTGAPERIPLLTTLPDARGRVLTGRLVRAVEPSGGACLVPIAGKDQVWLALLDEERCRVRPGPGREHLTVDAVSVNDLVLGERDVVARIGTGWPLSDDDGVLSRARVRHAAYLWGLGQCAHEQAVEHANRRSQFGLRLMEFQAVSFPLARAQVALTAVGALVSQAAGSADTGERIGLAAVEALALAAETTTQVVRSAVQVHGARGMARDMPVHSCYLKARSEATRFGDADTLWLEAGTRRLAAQGALEGVTRCA